MEKVESSIEENKSDGKVLLEYERAMINEMHKKLHKEGLTGNCFIVLAKGFSVSKFVATLLYEKYSIRNQAKNPESEESGSKKTISLKCSPFLIFIVNFQDIEFLSL